MEKSSFDPVRFKEQERAGFNLVAPVYEASMSLAAPASDRLVALAELEPGMRVIDVATGPGIIAREASREVGISGSVLGVDIAEEALKVARGRSEAEGLLQLTFEVGDAEALSLELESFDRVFCGLGLMHFPHPEVALGEFKRILKPGGKFLASVWGQEGKAPFIEVALRTVVRNFPPPKVQRPSMFRFGNPELLTALVQSSGFTEVETEEFQLEAEFPDAKTYWKNFLGAAGITAVAIAKQPLEIQQKLEEEVALDLEPYRIASGYRLKSIVLLVKATA